MENAEISVRASSLFREVNHRIQTVSTRQPGRMGELLCECGDPVCGEILTVTPAAYGRAREAESHFLFSNSHAGEGRLKVVERYDGCLVAAIV
jgi:hypothetical protein